MRQLTGQGWVHNRGRMVVASFLTKHLLVDWREGARFFLQHLVDGDLAANKGGWQWVAGTGTDAAPYYRIFTVQTSRLIRHIGPLAPEKLRAVEDALRFALAL